MAASFGFEKFHFLGVMRFPNHDYSKRGYLLPAGCKDITDVIKRGEECVSRPVADPPVTLWISLPEKVSVRFLAEISGQSLCAIQAMMYQLRICVGVNRSLDFDDAAKILRKYGIGAERDA
jgi:hypothetical protein